MRGQRDCVISARRAAAALVLLAGALTACSSSAEPQAEPWVPRAPAAAEAAAGPGAGCSQEHLDLGSYRIRFDLPFLVMRRVDLENALARLLVEPCNHADTRVAYAEGKTSTDA